jgi:hypothetical protein
MLIKKKLYYIINILFSSGQMEDRKDFFFDKRDTNYICLDSPFYFFEMFVRKKIKSDILIP